MPQKVFVEHGDKAVLVTGKVGAHLPTQATVGRPTGWRAEAFVTTFERIGFTTSGSSNCKRRRVQTLSLVGVRNSADLRHSISPVTASARA